MNEQPTKKSRRVFISPTTGAEVDEYVKSLLEELIKEIEGKKIKDTVMSSTDYISKIHITEKEKSFNLGLEKAKEIIVKSFNE